MKIYLASSVYNRAYMHVMESHIRSRFPNMDLIFTSKWYHQAPMPDPTDAARLDFPAIEAADVVLACYPHGPGTASEMGYAMGLGKAVIYYSSEADFDEDIIITRWVMFKSLEGSARHKVARNLEALEAALRDLSVQGPSDEPVPEKSLHDRLMYHQNEASLLAQELANCEPVAT